MITADTIHSTFTPGQITAGRSVPVCIDTDLAVATRVFLDAARRSMSPQTQADYATYERLAAHEESAADKAEAIGNHAFAASARKCADNYRSQAYAMLARILIASVSRENAE